MPSLASTRSGLLQQEINLLQQSGYFVSSHSDALGVWTLTVEAPGEKTGAGPLTLTVVCPPGFPIMPPAVHAPDLGMRHHQNPVDGQLCLLARPTQNWQPEWHLAGLLDRQLAKTIATGRSEDAGIDFEEDQGEPASLYFEYEPGAGVLLDTEIANYASSGSGSFQYHVAPIPVPGDGTSLTRLLAVIGSVEVDHSGSMMAPAELGQAFGSFQPVEGRGRWTFVDSPPEERHPDELWRLTQPQVSHSRPTKGGAGSYQFDLRALVFPEEHGHRRTGIGWLFVLRITPPSKGATRTPRRTVLVRAY